MRSLLLSLCAMMLLVGCAPTTDMIQDGHYKIQLTQTHYVWGQNVVHVTRCAVSDTDGTYCNPQDTRQYETTSIVSGPGAQIVSAALIGASIVGGAALMMHGLQTQNVTPAANSGPNLFASTVSGQPIPGLRFVAP